MEIFKKINGDELSISLIGSLTSDNSPSLEQVIKENINNVTSLVFDLKDLAYTSSAGLRVFLASHKIMANKGRMVIKNVNTEIMDVFEITGMINIFNIE